MNQFSRTGGLAIGLGVIAVLGVYLAARAVGADLMVAPEFGSGPAKQLEVFPAIAATVASGVVGAGLARLTPRFAQPARTFVGLCLAGLVIYGYLTVARSDNNSTVIWLNVMHVAAAVPIVGLLTHHLTKEH